MLCSLVTPLGFQGGCTKQLLLKQRKQISSISKNHALGQSNISRCTQLVTEADTMLISRIQIITDNMTSQNQIQTAKFYS